MQHTVHFESGLRRRGTQADVRSPRSIASEIAHITWRKAVDTTRNRTSAPEEDPQTLGISSTGAYTGFLDINEVHATLIKAKTVRWQPPSLKHNHAHETVKLNGPTRLSILAGYR
jgi:hypothetical protein